MSDWLKLHRSIIDSAQFSNPVDLKIWVWLLCKASFCDKNVALKIGRGTINVKIKRGQMIFGRHKAEEILMIDGSTIYKALQRMVLDKAIIIESNNQYSLITVCKYNDFQDKEDDEFIELEETVTTKEQPKNNQRTTKEQQGNNQVTAEEQQSNTIKKENNKKKVKKEKEIIADAIASVPMHSEKVVPLKKVAAKKNIAPSCDEDVKEPRTPTPYWAAIRRTYIACYKYYFKTEPILGPVDHSALKQLMIKIRQKAVEIGHETWEEYYAIDSLKAFFIVAIADPWLKDHFETPNLNKQFNSLYTKKENGKSTTANGNIKGHQDFSAASVFEKLSALDRNKQST